jgi:maltooligosyltrehalose trehalohydrolase
VKRLHKMPFGAQLQTGGEARFRLWAPSQSVLTLVLQGARGEQEIPMMRTHDDWFEIEIESEDVRAGSRYGFRLEDGLCVPDPASRFQPEGVHGLSEVLDPKAYDWQDEDWSGRPWEEVVLYELHVGTFTSAGTFRAAIEKMDHLVGLGVTAIELMPVADFPGRRNWGYDGVLPFAPDASYGRPDDLKMLVDAAHACGLMVFLDVVYNHFGPEGNYLHCYAPQFFTERHKTPWGAAINFDDVGSHTVRDFYIHNALYWLEEYHFDGLRFDAVHAIVDDTRPDILEELATVVHAGPGRKRHVHLVLENEHNAAHYLARKQDGQQHFVAQWNDDIHHVLHVLVTGEHEGYYVDYSEKPLHQLGRCLTEGFAYQGEPSPYRHGEARGESTRGLPLTAFVNFLQNHDQVGNRAFGERLTLLATPQALRAATAVLLLAPQPPMLFMGQEWGSRTPFPFFCDFGAELGAAVTAGRRREFAKFPAFQDPEARARIPDPNDPATFNTAVLDWHELERTEHREWLLLHRDLLVLRKREIVPRLGNLDGDQGHFRTLSEHALEVYWIFGDRSRLTLLANLGDEPLPGAERPAGELLYASAVFDSGATPPWGVFWYLERAT